MAYNFKILRYDSETYVSEQVFKYWLKVNRPFYKVSGLKRRTIHDKSYVALSSHRSQSLSYFYTTELFALYQNGKQHIIPKTHCNTFPFFVISDKSHLVTEVMHDELSNACLIKGCNCFDISIKMVGKGKISSISRCDYINDIEEYYTFAQVLIQLNLKHYTLTQTWFILYNMGLTIYYCNNTLYFKKQQIINTLKLVKEWVDNHIPINKLFALLHKQKPSITFNDEIKAPPAFYYYLIPDSKRGFYWINNISLELIDNVFNEKVNFATLMTEVESKGNLDLLPQKIPNQLASIFLNIPLAYFHKLNKNHSIFFNNSIEYCKKTAIKSLIELQKEYQKKYIPFDHVISFLGLNINNFSNKDMELLDTLSVTPIPDYIKYMNGNNNIKINKAYNKSEILGIRSFFHTEKNIPIKTIFDKNISTTTLYGTYLMRLRTSNIQLDEINVSSECIELWNRFVSLQLNTQRSSEKVANSMINRYINALNMLINLLKNFNLQDIYQLDTGMITTWYKYIGSPLYAKLLTGFFKFYEIEYADKGKWVKYSTRELKIPKSSKNDFDSVITPIYTFEEYSKLFNYCNDFYFHISAAIEEIIEFGTCTYASTWFYVMSHLNNAWRSSDFCNFPYIDVIDIVQRNCAYDLNWFLKNRLSKAESTIIILRLQNNPKIISKTRKYTNFTCSDVLLETYATLYVILAYYTNTYFPDNIDYVTHFNNKYNGLTKSQLTIFFSNLDHGSFIFKSRKMNKTLLSMVDFLENHYIDNEIDSNRRQAMLLRSHVTPETTTHYIKRNQQMFDTLTNMICARGEFGYAYEMLVKTTMSYETELSFPEMTDQVRKIRHVVPNMKDIDIIYGFLNFTHKELQDLHMYINSLSLLELQELVTKLYLNHLGSKYDRHLPCIKKNCTGKRNKDECTYCVYHIPSIYSLTIVCDSIKNDLIEFSRVDSELAKKKIMNKIFKKSRDLLWARDKYGDEILSEVLVLSGQEYQKFLNMLIQYLNTQTKMKSLEGDIRNARIHSNKK